MDSLWQVAINETDSLAKGEALLRYAQNVASGSTDEALLFVDSLIDVYQKREDTINWARARSMKSWFLNFQSRHEQATKEGHAVLGIQLAIGDTIGAAITMNRIGISYMYFKRYNDAQSYMEKALEVFSRYNDTSRMDMILNNLGVICSDQGNEREAIEYYQRSLQLRLKLGNYTWVAYSYSNIGDSYMSKGELDSAQYYFLKSIKTFRTRSTSKRVPALVAVSVSELYYLMGKYEEAFSWGEQALREASEVNHKEVMLEARKILSDILFEMGRFEQAFLMNKAYQELQVESDSANNFARVAEVEARYKNAEKEAEIAQLQSETLQARNRAQKLWIIVLVTAVVAGLIVFLIIFWYQKKLQRNALEQSELKARLSEIRMLALRSQMNPHFIFNCINTTQNFVLNSDKKAAYEYLSQFARLLRMVLENSGKNKVSLEDEMEQIRLYIELESIRFEGKFEHTIQLTPELENGIFEIPGMVLQPIVENAILHGLLNRKDDRGKLEIKLEKDKDLIHCEITDNGVGRTEAERIKTRKEVHYRSTALPNIHERLNILQQETGQTLRLEIRDLMNGQKPSGTAVHLWLPYS
ncbi:MAG: tetratricopeptide repeat protein [Owenweeksia sp.]